MGKDTVEGPRKATSNAGAFLGPYGTFPVDTHTLSDDVPREPSEFEAEQFGPGPRPAPRSLLERFWQWVNGVG